VLPHERNEPGSGDAASGNELRPHPLEQGHVLAAATADRLHEPATFDQLLGKGWRHTRERGRDEDRVERGPVRQTRTAVTDDDVDVAESLTREVRLRSRRQIGVALDAQDVRGEPGEDGRLEPVPCADLEHPFRARQRECLDHLGD
jgi:hypothetical protein